MIWNSNAMMSVFDITIIVAVLFPLVILLKQRQQTRRSGLYRGLRTIVLGLLVLGGFYLVDLLTMYALPSIGLQTLSMQLMTSLHLNIHWLASLVGIPAMAFGLSYLIWILIPKLALDERMAFESLLSRISTRLINIQPEEFDDAFSIALREVGQHLEVSRGFLAILEPGGATMQIVHEWAAEGVPRLSAGDKYKSFTRKDLPWYFDRIVAGKTIAIACCAEHPDVSERRFCHDAGIKSEIGLPMIVDGSAIGCVGFEAVRSERVWTDSEVKQLELLAQMFAGALARQRADEALRESEFQLDKAQRIARIGHFIWDEIEGECAFRSAVLDDIVGLSPGEPVRSLQVLLDRIHPDDRQRFTNSFAMAAEDVGLWDVQYRVVHPDGQVRHVHQVSSPEFDENRRLIRTVGTIQDITEHKAIESELVKHQNKLQRLSSELSLAEERERRSIATDLHDSVVQTLTLAKIKLGESRKRIARSEPETRIEEVGDLLDQSLRESRSLVSEISPPMLYELGLEPALEWLADYFEARHDLILKIKMDSPVKPLGQSIEVFVYQAVRELLLNIIKHAQATRASVMLLQKDGQVNLVVKDNGVGCDSSKIGLQVTNSGGFGLFNLRERVGFFGGHLIIESDSGTRVSLSLPLDSDENR
jgi:PAS domain S-box-containing protein